MLLASPSLWSGWVFDDYMQPAVFRPTSIGEKFFSSPLHMFDFAGGTPERNRELMDLGFLPWWTFEGFQARFLRPVTVFTHWIDYRLWPNCIPLMHLHSLLWYAALVFIVAHVYRTIMGGEGTKGAWLAGLAGLLYAVDDVHAVPAGWLANRNGLIAGCLGLLSFLAYVRWRRGDRWGAFLAPALLAAGLLANEGAIAACAYAFAYTVCLEEGPRWKRIASLVPMGLVVVVWRIVYNAMGRGTLACAAYVDPLHAPLDYVQALLFRLPVLFLAQWAGVSPDLLSFIPHWVAVIWCLAGVALILWIAIALSPLLRKNAVARFWAVAMGLSFLPIVVPFPMERLLLFVGVGGMGLVAQLLNAKPPEGAYAENPTLWRRVARPLCWMLIVAHLIVGPVTFPLKIAGFTWAGKRVAKAIETAPVGEDVEDKTVVLVDAPNLFFAAHFQMLREIQGLAAPKHVRALAPNRGFKAPLLRYKRADEHTLILDTSEEFSFFLVRNLDHPFKAGDRVTIAGMTVDILAVTKEGNPTEVAYRFDVPLEDESLVWLEERDGKFFPFSPPTEGEVCVLPP